MNKIFEMFCDTHHIDGALKVRLSRIYNDTHDLGSLILELRNLGNEKTLEIDRNLALKLTGRLDTIATYTPNKETSLARAHSANELKRRIFGIGRERNGD